MTDALFAICIVKYSIRFCRIVNILGSQSNYWKGGPHSNDEEGKKVPTSSKWNFLIRMKFHSAKIFIRQNQTLTYLLCNAITSQRFWLRSWGVGERETGKITINSLRFKHSNSGFPFIKQFSSCFMFLFFLLLVNLNHSFDYLWKFPYLTCILFQI